MLVIVQYKCTYVPLCVREREKKRDRKKDREKERDRERGREERGRERERERERVCRAHALLPAQPHSTSTHIPSHTHTHTWLKRYSGFC